ncbi:unnamed protein product [Trichogramma brassicae]|uniref:Uncharacterized protein n=1 Tax=Trichogramma brassicae TaxID=86971 RepID=A0A6H5HY16_9HYME|nr:unnamed protein product [Trichogramma brassicae]
MLCRRTALHRAKYNQRYPIARELFKIYDRFDINYIDEKFGYTHFHVACEWGCKDVVEKFLELGQDLNILVTGTGSSLLHLALMSDDVDPEMIEILLRHGANPNVVNKRGFTAVHLISMGPGDSDLMQMLIDLTDNKHQPVRIHLQDERNGLTALEYAVARNLKNVTETLLKNGAEVNYIDETGSTPLHTVCLGNKDVELAKVLFKFGARIDAQNDNGCTPLHYAVYRGINQLLVEFLLRNGADPNKAENDGSTHVKSYKSRLGTRRAGHRCNWSWGIFCRYGFADQFQIIAKSVPDRRLSVVAGHGRRYGFGCSCRRWSRRDRSRHGDRIDASCLLVSRQLRIQSDRIAVTWRSIPMNTLLLLLLIDGISDHYNTNKETHSNRSLSGTPTRRPSSDRVSSTASRVLYCGSSSGRQISISAWAAIVRAPISTSHRPIDTKMLKKTNLYVCVIFLPI